MGNRVSDYHLQILWFGWSPLLTAPEKVTLLFSIGTIGLLQAVCWSKTILYRLSRAHGLLLILGLLLIHESNICFKNTENVGCPTWLFITLLSKQLGNQSQALGFIGTSQIAVLKWQGSVIKLSKYLLEASLRFRWRDTSLLFYPGGVMGHPAYNFLQKSSFS